MAKTKSKKQKLAKNSAADGSSLKIEKKLKKKKKIKLATAATASSDSESDSDPNTTIQTLLEPFTKDQVISLVTDLSLADDSLLAIVRSTAEQDVSHRKIFVHGLGWECTHESVESVFAPYGEIEDLRVVTDRSTGKCKGYAFVTFRSRKSAKKLLKTPRIKVENRVVSCNLASEGSNASPATPGVVSQQNFTSDYPQRKIYVSNVPGNASAEKLRLFFDKFGEIESGPKGFDPVTGKCKGYAIFVYRTLGGAKNVLEDPCKVFEGSQLYCQKATEGKNKFGDGAASITTGLQSIQPKILAQVAATQNIGLLGQQAGFVNPFYGGGMIANANMGALMRGYYGMMGQPLQRLSLGAYGGSSTGDYGSSWAMPQGFSNLYPNIQSGKTSSYSGKAAGAGGSGGHPTNL